jgi:hypothetical protein
MKKIYTTILALSIFTSSQAQVWSKISSITDSTQIKGIGVINNQILAAGQNWASSSVTDYALSTDGGSTWSKIPTYSFAGYLPNVLPQNNLTVCSNGFTSSKKLVGTTWSSFSGAYNFAEFTNGSIIGSTGSYPDTVYNFSPTGVKGAKLGNYKFKLSAKYGNGSCNRVFVFGYGVGFAYIDYSNLGVLNFPATLDGVAMTQTSWDLKVITDVVKASTGTLFAIGDGVFKSIDNGVNWTTSLYLSGTPISRIAKNSSDALFILVGNAEVRMSTDLGVTFTNISGNLPTTGIGAFKTEIFVNPGNEVFVILNKNGGAITGLNSGVFKLTDINGINENSKTNLGFKLFPNPSNTFLNIETENLNTSVYIVITDVLGNTILSKTTTENKIQISVSNFTKGVYFITVSDGKKNNTQKLIIN